MYKPAEVGVTLTYGKLTKTNETGLSVIHRKILPAHESVPSSQVSGKIQGDGRTFF